MSCVDAIEQPEEPTIQVTPKAVEKIRQASPSEGVTGGGLRLGVLGGGCSGLSYQFKYDPSRAPTDNVFEFDDVQVFVDPKSMVYPERDDARLQGIADAVRLRVRESAREEELWLRHLVLGVMSECWQCGPQRLSSALLRAQPPQTVQFSDRPKLTSRSRAFLRAEPAVASGPVHAQAAAGAAAYRSKPPPFSTTRYRSLRDPVQRAEYVLKQSGFDIGEQRSKDVPPELLEEVFELNMALEEMRTATTRRGRSSKMHAQVSQRCSRGDRQRTATLVRSATTRPGSREVLDEIRGVSEPPQVHSESCQRSGESSRPR